MKTLTHQFYCKVCRSWYQYPLLSDRTSHYLDHISFIKSCVLELDSNSEIEDDMEEDSK